MKAKKKKLSAFSQQRNSNNLNQSNCKQWKFKKNISYPSWLASCCACSLLTSQLSRSDLLPIKMTSGFSQYACSRISSKTRKTSHLMQSFNALCSFSFVSTKFAAVAFRRIIVTYFVYCNQVENWIESNCLHLERLGLITRCLYHLARRSVMRALQENIKTAGLNNLEL